MTEEYAEEVALLELLAKQAFENLKRAKHTQKPGYSQWLKKQYVNQAEKAYADLFYTKRDVEENSSAPDKILLKYQIQAALGNAAVCFLQTRTKDDVYLEDNFVWTKREEKNLKNEIDQLKSDPDTNSYFIAEHIIHEWFDPDGNLADIDESKESRELKNIKFGVIITSIEYINKKF